MEALIPCSSDLPTSNTDVLSYPVPVSHVICANPPLTPPLSPKPGQNVANIDPTPPDNEYIAVETNDTKDPGNIIPHLMDVDPEPFDDSLVDPPPPPQRLLEDEEVHLQRSGIKLADFEVRGTLGRTC